MTTPYDQLKQITQVLLKNAPRPLPDGSIKEHVERANQMLKMPWSGNGGSNGAMHLWDVDPAQVENREIRTGDHCFGCTAGAGSSCGGALV